MRSVKLTPVRVEELTNSRCDVRKYMRIDIDDGTRQWLIDQQGYTEADIDEILENATIYVDYQRKDEFVIPVRWIVD